MVAHKLPADEVNPVLYESLQGLPPGVKGEIVDGRLIVVPHAFLPHTLVATRLTTLLSAMFEFGIGGPGGWVFASDPQLNLGSEVFCPDATAWKRERSPEGARGHAQVVPDWAAEVLSDRTWKQDRDERIEAWGRRDAAHVWLLDTDNETLEVYWNDAGVMRPLQSFQGRVKVRAAPFDTVELDLGLIWPRQP